MLWSQLKLDQGFQWLIQVHSQSERRLRGWGVPKGPGQDQGCLLGPWLAECGFIGNSGMQAWAEHCPSMNVSQGFGLSVCSGLFWTSGDERGLT